MVEISVSYLYHICTLETGDAPMTWLKNLRLDKTREYLADPDCFLQVKEIGVLVGLTNMSHFAKDFKAKFGATPTNYRNQQAEIYYSKPPDGQK